MEPSNDFTLDALKNLEPLVNPVRTYRNRSKKKKQRNDESQEECNQATSTGSSTTGGETKLADVLTKITSLNKTSDDNVDRTKLIRTYNVKLRLKKPCLYKCFDCDSCFTNADFLELHEKSHNAGAASDGSAAAVDTSGSTTRNDIDLQQEQSFDESEMIVKQNAWFADDFGDADEQDGDDGMIQLDCTVEEREDNFDITFDRTKCEKTYTVVKYKVKKDPVGKCETCERMFYTMESLQLHKMEHERFMDFDAIEPTINIDSPSIEESTLVLDESFYQAETEMDSSDILEASDSAADVRRGPTSGGLRNGECKPNMRRPLQTQAATRRAGGTIEGQFQCEICSKRFRFRPAFNVHIRTHDNSRPFQCGECQRRFISRAKLFLHSYGHSRDRRAALRCDVCEDTFSRPRQLLEHLQQGHVASTEVV